MKIKRAFLVFLIGFWLLGGTSPLCAQKNFSKLIRKIVIPKKFSLHSFQRRLPAVPAATWKVLDNQALAQFATQRTLISASPLFMPDITPDGPRPSLPAPKAIRQAVFTLQHNPQTHGKGSAFAIKIDGEVWGVTARHVLDDIGRSPFLSVTDKNGQEHFFQVQSVQEGNVRGADVAIFRIPKPALAYLKPLLPQYQLPKAYSVVQSAGFSYGNFGWFPRIDVLFASDHRILARYANFPVRSGYCGSPLLKNGKVLGVFVGITSAEQAQTADWFKLIGRHFRTPMSSFTQVVPVSWVRRLVRQEKGLAPKTALPVKLLGQTVTLLHPDETIVSIQQLRKGRLFKTIPAYPFMDYNRMEAFLDVAPQDVLYLTVQQGDRSSLRRKFFVYQLDPMSGQVTRTETKNHE